jgi:hypothetical protein
MKRMNNPNKAFATDFLFRSATQKSAEMRRYLQKTINSAPGFSVMEK